MDRVAPDDAYPAMIEQEGRVVAVADGLAWVDTRRASACGTCSVSGGCGTSVVAKLLGEGANRLAVTDHIGVAVGDLVVIGIGESALTRAALLAYLLPLAVLMGAAFLAERAGAGDGLNALSGLLGLSLGLWGTGYLARRSDAQARYRPVLLRRRAPIRSSGGRKSLRQRDRGQNFDAPADLASMSPAARQARGTNL
jgi:sigma-E factor negative regulatory protein RseC